jgi:hypothetical protein
MRKLLLCSVLLASACGLSVGALDVQPNVLRKSSASTLMVRIDKDVPDAGRFESDGGPSVDLEAWHETLARAFHRGFDRYFAPKGRVLTLVLLRADPHAAWTGRDVIASIAYQAELFDDHGSIVGTYSGTALGPLPQGNPSLSNRAMTSAVAEMYERIASQPPLDL